MDRLRDKLKEKFPGDQAKQEEYYDIAKEVIYGFLGMVDGAELPAKVSLEIVQGLMKVRMHEILERNSDDKFMFRKFHREIVDLMKKDGVTEAELKNKLAEVQLEEPEKMDIPSMDDTESVWVELYIQHEEMGHEAYLEMIKEKYAGFSCAENMIQSNLRLVEKGKEVLLERSEL